MKKILLFASLMSLTSVAGFCQVNTQVDIQDNSRRVIKSEINVSGNGDPATIASDAQILNAVQNLISNSYRGFHLNIKVSDGVVIIKGTLKNGQDIENIVRDVHNIPGVKDVQVRLN